MKTRLLILCLILSILAAAGLSPAGEEDEKNALASSWVNYGHYLIDIGEYGDALTYFRSAFEEATLPVVREDALLAQAMVLGWFLDEPDQAVALYRKGAEIMPGSKGLFQFQTARLLSDAGRREQGIAEYKKYLRLYPDGDYYERALAALDILATTDVKPPALAERVKLPVVRVGLSSGTGQVAVSSSSGKLCVDGIGCAQRFDITPGKSGILVNGKPAGGRVSLSSRHPLKIRIGRKERTVNGSLEVVLWGGRLVPVNVLDIETYLKAVVPAEVSASWPMAALKAQAVAARSYAFHKLKHDRGEKPYTVLCNTHDQMYTGIDRHSPRSNAAIEATAGQVLTYGGLVAYTQYSAHSGGVTGDSYAVFGVRKPYLISHEDEPSKARPKTWKTSVSLGQLENRLRAMGRKVSGVRKIEPALVGPSGRITKIRVHHAGGTSDYWTRRILVRKLGFKETLMTFNRRGNVYYFDGRGDGHGLGMSQWGAYVMGKRNNEYDEILAFYYPGTKLEKLWQEK